MECHLWKLSPYKRYSILSIRVTIFGAWQTRKVLSRTTRIVVTLMSALRTPRRFTCTGPAVRNVIFVVVNFDALAQASDFRIERRQVVFLCWMQDTNAEGLWNPIFSRLNASWQTDWAIEDQAKNLNSTARPYDQQAFSPPDPTAIWHSHLALVIYIFVVVNFDALAQASDFRIERRLVVFLCLMQNDKHCGHSGVGIAHSATIHLYPFSGA